MVGAEMPRYRCHKEVWALEIKEITAEGIVPVESGYALIAIEDGLFARYEPKPGDYLVIYNDGYQSVSPKAAFEAGYAKIL